jgi:hypothetical protein
MDSLSRKSRVGLAVSYAALIVLPCLVIMFFVHLPLARVITFLTYAFALLPTYYLGQWFLNGTGFNSAATFVLFALVVALAFWPFPVLITLPSAWSSMRWRRVFFGYAVLLASGVLLAAWQMTKSWHLFFG